MIIGICGKSGSGKSTLARKIIEMYPNSIHVEIDKVGHKALMDENVKKELVKSFGEKLLNDNVVDRKQLGDIVFNSRHEMNKLTDITWEYMQKEIDKIIDDNKNNIVILDWLLLPKTKYFDMCDYKVLLDVDYETRKQRCMLRDNISEDKFDLRENNSVDYYNDFDYVIHDVDELDIEGMVLNNDKSIVSRKL